VVFVIPAGAGVEQRGERITRGSLDGGAEHMRRAHVGGLHDAAIADADGANVQSVRGDVLAAAAVVGIVVFNRTQERTQGSSSRRQIATHEFHDQPPGFRDLGQVPAAGPLSFGLSRTKTSCQIG